jgi:hypothetical protein
MENPVRIQRKKRPRIPNHSATAQQVELLKNLKDFIKTIEGQEKFNQEIKENLGKPQIHQHTLKKLFKRGLESIETLEDTSWLSRENTCLNTQPLKKSLTEALETLKKNSPPKRDRLLEDHKKQQKKEPLQERLKTYNPLEILEETSTGRTLRVNINGFSTIMKTTWGNDPFLQGF